MLKLEGGKYYIDEPALIKKVSKARNSDAHTHDFIEITYTLRGKCTHTVDGEEFLSRHGDMIIINYKQIHTLTVSEDAEYVNILLKPEIINESIKDSENAFSLLALEDFEDFKSSVNKNNRFISFDINERAKIETLIDILISESESGPGSILMKRSSLNMLMIFLFRKMSLPIQEGFGGINSSLLRYIKESCEKNLTAKVVSKLCSYEPSYFSRLFKEKTGKTFTRYLCECRLERASVLLKTTDMPVEQIISESGFSDRTKFFTEFEKATGYSPLKYRKSQKSILF